VSMKLEQVNPLNAVETAYL